MDDDEGMRVALETLLDVAGFKVDAFSSAEALLRDGTIDGAVCLVSDLRLPSISGLEMITALRARGEQIPVIAITAHDEPGVRDKARRRGACAYLAKPFLGSDLLAAIERVAKHSTSS